MWPYLDDEDEDRNDLKDPILMGGVILVLVILAAMLVLMFQDWTATVG